MLSSVFVIFSGVVRVVVIVLVEVFVSIWVIGLYLCEGLSFFCVNLYIVKCKYWNGMFMESWVV